MNTLNCYCRRWLSLPGSFLLFLLGVLLMEFVLPVSATPLTVINLGSETAWSCKGESDTDWSPIVIPGQKAAGNNKWVDYQREITIPQDAANRVTLLTISSINDGGFVYLNDYLLEQVTYGLFQAKVDITNFVEAGKTYILRVRCCERNSYYPNGVFPMAHNYGKSVGMPRGISLEIYPEVYISDVMVHSSVAKKQLTYDLWVCNHATKTKTVVIKAQLSPWNPGFKWRYPVIPEATVTIPAGTTVKVTNGPVAWKLGTKSYWWPNIPFNEEYVATLHNLTLSLNEGHTRLDRTTRRFGFAEYSEGVSYYQINGIRVFQLTDSTQESMWRGPFQTSYLKVEGWGDGPNGAKETWKRYMRLGVNTYRIHNSAATEVMLNAADEVGMMLVGESAIRGYANPEETWDPIYKPATIKAMVRFYRSHPSLVRYSLENEWGDATRDSEIARELIDAAVSEDTTRPMTFSQNLGPYDTKFYGSDQQFHAWVLDHYHEPIPCPTEIRGTEEMYWDGAGSVKGHELIECARAGVVFRAQQHAAFGFWCLRNYWPNFVQGAAQTGRKDKIDGWNSDIIQFVQNCFDPFCSADLELIDKHLNTEQLIFDPAKAEVHAETDTITRQMVMFNNSLSNHRQQINWETRFDSPTGPLMASGVTEMVTMAPGTQAYPIVSFPCPGTNGVTRILHFIINTMVDGKMKFTENRYFFKIRNARPLAVSLPGGKSAVAVRHTLSITQPGQVVSSLELLTPLPAQARSAVTGRVRLTLVNNSTVFMATGRIQLAANNTPLAGTECDYQLSPGATVTKELTVEFSPGTTVLETFPTRTDLLGSELMVQMSYAISRIPLLETPEQIAKTLAELPALDIKNEDKVIGKVRCAISGEMLVVLANSLDKQVVVGNKPFDGAEFEVFGATSEGGKLGQVFLISGTRIVPAKGCYLKDTQIVSEPSILVSSTISDDGYEISALIPLKLFNIDHAARSFLLEIESNAVLQSGQNRQYYPLFGSPAPYQNTGKYGHVVVE